MSALLCHDCGQDVGRHGLQEYGYMVHDDVWAAAGLNPGGGFLCVGCIEQRLGRQLTPHDFKPEVPLNRMPGQSPRLRARING